MTNGTRRDFDAIVVGAGFYGCSIAVALAQHFSRVALIEKHAEPITRASYVNQARVHNGYHYPRSFITGMRSACNFPRFTAEFADCIDNSFEKLYAIASQQSKVNAFQFEKFCRRIGAPVRPAPPRIARLFNPDLIEAVFCVTEYAFDAAQLRRIMSNRLEQAGVHRMFGREVMRAAAGPAASTTLDIDDGSRLSASLVINCAYSRINVLLKRSDAELLPLKHEIAEVVLIEPPEELRGYGVTLMDGPFFSTMPFPALGLHSLSHVRYTPHESWREPEQVRDPHKHLAAIHPSSKSMFMLKDARRYLPCMAGAHYVQSLFEVKTVLAQSEVDDGRPILLRPHPELGNVITVMGGKIDNIYDVLDEITGRMASHRAEAASNAR